MPLLKRYGWIVGLMIIGTVIVLTNQTKSTEVDTVEIPVKSQPSIKEGQAEQIEIKVDVKGEVQHPGVYLVEEEMRVDDVISLAGGLTADADPTSVNLALKLQDEMVIMVSKVQSNKEGDTSAPSSDLLVLNQATVEEIQSLNGIGPSKAAAIVQYREESGPFKDKKDLLKVSGIGEKTLENIIEDIRVP